MTNLGIFFTVIAVIAVVLFGYMVSQIVVNSLHSYRLRKSIKMLEREGAKLEKLNHEIRTSIIDVQSYISSIEEQIINNQN